MPKTISVSEAKNRLSALLSWAEANRDEVIVESRGRAKAVILPFAEYETFLALREGARRREAVRRLQELAEQNQARNQDLTAAQAEQLADETVREAAARLVTQDNS